MVNILFHDDREALGGKNILRSLYGPACGTGGMLSVAEEYLHRLNPTCALLAFGQELNDQTYAICKADMLIKGNDASNIRDGNTLFTSDAGSSPSEIRKHIMENDLLEAIIALPNDIFYNTGIATYIWVLSNNRVRVRDWPATFSPNRTCPSRHSALH